MSRDAVAASDKSGRASRSRLSEARSGEQTGPFAADAARVAQGAVEPRAVEPQGRVPRRGADARGLDIAGSGHVAGRDRAP